MFGRVWGLIIKELLALLKDVKSRMVIVFPPLVELFVFSYAATFDLNEIPYAVYNESSGEAAREFLAKFEGAPTFRRVAVIERESDIGPLIDSKKVLLVIHLGPRFEHDLHIEGSAPVQAIVDGRNSNTAATALTYVRTLVDDFNQQWASDRGSGSSGAGESGAGGLGTRLTIRAWFNPNFESQWFIVPGIVGMLTLVVSTLVTAMSVAREREQGTFDQLLVTPLRPLEIMLGKAIPGFMIGLVEVTFTITAAVVWFKVPLLGSLLTLYAGIALFLLSAIGMGLMISSLCMTQQQAMLGAFLFMVPANIISGFATPIANMPVWIQYITLVNPLRYYLVILRSVFLEGTPFYLLLDQFWPMALIAVATLGAATVLFRWRVQ